MKVRTGYRRLMMENFEIIKEKLGEGSFGMVSAARHRQTSQIVALKKIRVNTAPGAERSVTSTALRELQALKHLSEPGHPNVVKLFDSFADGSCICMVLEYCETDLQKLIQWHRGCEDDKRLYNEKFAIRTRKQIIRSLLRAVLYLHTCSLLHRDIKPSNILITSNGVVKLADFGLTRVHVEMEGDEKKEKKSKLNYSHQVASRWYRPPELLFGARQYGQSADMWSVGCIFAEILSLSPAFPGENDIDQIHKVIQVLGSPNIESDWPEATLLPDFNKVSFTPFPCQNIGDCLCPGSQMNEKELLGKILCWNPKRRISAVSALCDKYFFSEPLPGGLKERVESMSRIKKKTRANEDKGIKEEFHFHTKCAQSWNFQFRKKRDSKSERKIILSESSGNSYSSNVYSSHSDEYK
eukprot:g5162.t1